MIMISIWEKQYVGFLPCCDDFRSSQLTNVLWWVYFPCPSLASHVAHRPWQKEDGLLIRAGFGSWFGLTVLLQSNIPVVLLREIRVVVVFFILLQEVTLIVHCLLGHKHKTQGEGEKGKSRTFNWLLIPASSLTTAKFATAVTYL